MLLEFLWILIPSSVTGVLVVLLVSLIVWWQLRRPKNTPPGPWGVPLFGFLPFLTEGNPAAQLYKLSRKYGPVVSVDLGSAYTIIISDFNLIKKAYVETGDVFAGRPAGFSEVLSHKDKTMLFSSGLRWSEQRRFALTTLRDFGMGKSSLEPKILDELSILTKRLIDFNEQPFNAIEAMCGGIANVISQLAFGKRFDYEDPKFQRLHKELFDILALSTMTGGLLEALPWLKNFSVIRRLFGLTRMDELMGSQLRTIQEIIDDHYKTYYPGKRDDYIDSYFEEKETRQRTGQHPDIFDDEALLYDLQMLFLAGTETTTDTLVWALLYAMVHPDVQRKIQKEIDDVIGPDRQPSMNDRPNMPYTDAFIMESHRIIPLVPLIDSHSVLQDTELNGYFIPKDTMVLANQWAVNRDPKLWGDPESFRPERFINEKGQAVRPEYLIPFSIGRRQCAGEALARMELFLFVTSIFQKFTLLPEEGKHVDLTMNISAIIMPSPFKMRAIIRNN